MPTLPSIKGSVFAAGVEDLQKLLASKTHPPCWSTEGFINAMARQHQTPDLWTSKRPEPDSIVWRMTREI